jgi:hypothetical protein
MAKKSKKRRQTARRRPVVRPSIRPAEIPNQVFLAIPWKTVRPKYEKAVDALARKYPLHFVIVGREPSQDAEDLLEIIKQRLLASSYAIFDASGGNANVSLEYGFAEAHDIQRALYYCDHGAAKKAAKDAPIIADLAGKRRNHYKQEAALKKLLTEFCAGHPYTKRFEQFVRSKFKSRSAGAKRTARTMALKVIRCLDGDGTARRTDVVQRLLADNPKYRQNDVDRMILAMHQDGLVLSIQGPHSTVTVV